MTVTTAEEHNIDQPELSHYLGLQIENGSLPNALTSAEAYSLTIYLKHVIYSILSWKIDLISTFPLSL